MTQQIAPDIETASEDYARRFAGEVGEYFLQIQRNIILKMVSRISSVPLNILELGGGHAQLTPAFLASGHRVSVHGSNNACLGRVRELKDSAGEKLNLVVAELPGVIPVDDRSFDVVVAIRLLAHIDRWDQFLVEAMRIARRAVIVDYAPRFGFNALTPVLYSLKKNVEGNTRPYLCQWDSEIREVFSSGGFEVTSIAKQFAIPMGVHRAIGNRSLSSFCENGASALGLTKLFGSPAIALAERK